MAKRLLKTMLLPLTVIAAAFAFIACDGTAPDIKYKVTYVIGADAEGTAPTETDKAFGEKFKLKSVDGITPPTGKKFDGWNDGSLTYQAGAEYTMPSKAVTFTAQWGTDGEEPATYPVTYDLNGGTGEVPAVSYKGASEKFNLAVDDDITPPAGKEFDGWSDGEKKYDAGAEYTMSGKAVTFTAQWKDAVQPAAKYTVTYKYGAAGDDVVKPNQTAANYTVEAPTVYEDYGDDEYYKLFAGWTIENGDGTVYLPDSKCTLTGDTVFTAQWVDFDDDYIWVDTTYELQLALLTDKVGTLILYLGGEDEENPDFAWTYFTYAVSGTAITLTPVNGNSFTGTLDDGELTISIKLGMTTYKFEPEQEQPTGVPTFTFQLNGGSGTLPTLTATEDMKKGDYYMVPMPANTITPPAGKAFKQWTISDGKGTWSTKAGSKFSADPGVTYTVKPEWEDSGEPAPGGVVLYGNCTLPTKTSMGQTLGGETVVQIVIDTTDPQNVKIKYMLADDVAYSNEKTGDGGAYAQYKPDVYGDDALYYGSFLIGSVSYNIVVKPDLTALWLCDTTDDEPLDNGEFTTGGVTPPAPVTYTVTYVKPSGVEGEAPAVATVESGEQVWLPEVCPFTKAGWTFYRWKVSGIDTLRAANTPLTVTGNITVTPVFSADYNGDYGKITVLDNDTLIIVDFENATCGYTRNGNIVVIDYDGIIMTAKVDDAAKTYVMANGMQNYTYTAANNTTLTFDGFGVATLGTHTGTYTLSEDYDKFTLVIGGNTYSNIAIGTTITVTITIDGTEYVFGNSTPNPPPANDKLADYVGGNTTASAITYGYVTVDAAKAANKDITATNVNGDERTFYQARVNTNYSGNLNIYIYADTGSVSGPKNSDGQNIAVTEDTPNQTIYISTGSWANQFVITFSKNSDGKRVMTITYGDITVQWVEITA